MCKVSDRSEMVGEIIGWFDMELPVCQILESLNCIIANVYRHAQNKPAVCLAAASTLAYEFKLKASIESVSCTIEEDVHTYLAD